MPEALRIAVPTRNRPQLLSRVVDSILEDVGRSGRPVELLIADQSDPPVERRNAACLRRAAKRLNGDIYHLGSRARQATAEIGPPETARLSGGPSREDRHGENRNWISLFFAGRPYASFDDDVVVSGVASSELRGADGPRPDSPIPWSFLAYPSHADMRSAVDALPVHRSVTAEIVDGLRRGGSGPGEAFVVPGVAGHSGLASHVLLSDTSCRLSARRLLASDQAFAGAMRATSVVRQAARHRVDAMKGLVATAFAVGNRAPTVPFMPWGRGEDHVLCKALRTGGTAPLVISPDLSVLHLPQHARSPAGTVDGAGVASIATAAMDLVGDCGSADRLVAELLRIAQGRDRGSSLKAALLAHAERQMQYCAHVAQAAAGCATAFAAAEVVMLQWQALAQQCRAARASDTLAARLDEAAEPIRRMALLGTAWPRLWTWFETNRASIRNASRVPGRS